MKSVLFLLGASLFSYLLNNILLRFSRNFGVSSRQEQTGIVRWASTSKPTTGGISFYITFLVGSLTLMLLRPIAMGAGSAPFLALLFGATMAFLIGFADDAYGTHPRLKLLGQVFCGVILIYFDVYIAYFSLADAGLIWLDYALTIFWVVGLMNSLNMLDNMDGVTATIALTIIISTMTMLISREGIHPLFYMLIAISGGFIGFLFWNWRPAKVYMGDTGSMFIGLVLAFFGILYFWNSRPAPDNISHARIALIPIMAFIVPIMDTTFVTVARIARGSSPFVGGKDHLTHNLVRIGIPEEWVPITLGMVSTVSGALAFFAYKLTPEWRPFYSVMFAAYPIVLTGIFAMLYIRGARIHAVKERLDREARQREPIGIETLEATASAART
ncbi:MAG: MraY family glycosyltransferase [Bacteroidia bacterium]|nr:MraY family glycosyltransferase [Bacteroidia bacterium]